MSDKRKDCLRFCWLLIPALFFGMGAADEKTTDHHSLRSKVGQEVAIPVHMQDGEEYQASLRDLIAYGKRLFTAAWTIQEGAGRPMSKGTGMMLADLRDPLLFPPQLQSHLRSRFKLLLRVP
jgi:hypothetical protein